MTGYSHTRLLIRTAALIEVIEKRQGVKVNLEGITSKTGLRQTNCGENTANAEEPVWSISAEGD